MSDKPSRTSHLLRSTVDRVLVHDIKNMGFRLQMLLSNLDEHYPDPEFKKSVEELLRSTIQRLDGIVGRFSAHEDSLLIKVTVDLNGVLRDIASGTTRRGAPGVGAKGKGPTLDLRLGEIPEVWGDPYYLRDALWSLIDNAIEVTPSGGKIQIRSYCDTSLPQRRVVVAIIDDGPGMSPEAIRNFRSQLFKPFQTTKPQGVGLGLSTAAEIIRFHNGSIRAVNRPGRGAIVCVVFLDTVETEELAVSATRDLPPPAKP